VEEGREGVSSRSTCSSIRCYEESLFEGLIHKLTSVKGGSVRLYKGFGHQLVSLASIFSVGSQDRVCRRRI
jgi:hypothetical protein